MVAAVGAHHEHAGGRIHHADDRELADRPVDAREHLVGDLARDQRQVDFARLEQPHVLAAALGRPSTNLEDGIDRTQHVHQGLAIDDEGAALGGGGEGDLWGLRMRRCRRKRDNGNGRQQRASSEHGPAGHRPARRRWSTKAAISGSHCGCIERHAAGPFHQVKLECHILRIAPIVGLGAHADQTVAQPALERAQVLPFQAIDRIARRMALRNGRAGELLARIVVVAVGAGQVELALPAPVERRALAAERRQARIVGRGDRLAARLQGNVGRKGQQLAAFAGERRGVLLRRPAKIDAAFEIDRLARAGGDRGIARGHALHACRVRVTVGAGLVGRAGLLLPQRLARLHEQHGRVGGVVVLHLLQRRAHVVVTRAARLACLCERERGGEHRSEAKTDPEPRHVTAMAT